MANTVTNIYNYSTFGDLIRTVYSSTNAWDYLGFKDWDKPTGQFSISTSGIGFVANTQSKFNYRVWVTGTGGYLEVDNNAEVKKTLTLSNTYILCFDAKGSANIRDLELTNSTSSLVTAGNTIFKKNATIYNTGYINYAVANTITISGTTFGNVAYLSSNLTCNYVTANSGIYSTGESRFTEKVKIDKELTSLSLTANNIYCNNNVLTSNLRSSNTIVANNIVANNVITSNKVVSNTINVDIIFANTVGELDGDGIPTVANVYTKKITSQDGYFSGSLFAGGGMQITGDINYISTSLLLSSDTPIWNSGVTTSEIIINRTVDNLQDPSVVYPNYANAVLGWNETTGRWRVVDVLNSPSYNNPVYYNILLAQDITDVLTVKGTTTVPSSNVANTLHTMILNANTWLQANAGYGVETANVWLISKIDTANAWLQANVGFGIETANVWLQANTGLGVSNANTWLQANTGLGIATANAWLQANTGLGVSNANTWLTSRIDTANNWLQANTGFGIETANVWLQANTGLGVSNANTWLTSRIDTANNWLQENIGAGIITANVWLQAYTDTSNTFVRNYTDAANTWLQANTGAGIATANAWLQANTTTEISKVFANTLKANIVTISSNQSVIANYYTYVVTGSNFTITLPTSPDVGNTIHFISNTVSNVTINRAAQRIMTLAEDMIIDANSKGFNMIYIDSAIGWFVK